MDTTMRKVEQAMIQAIDNCPPDRAGRIFNGGNTVVERWHHGIHGTIGYDAGFSVTLYRTEIARWSSYDPSSVTLNHGWYRTVTTKSRINAILKYLYGGGIGLYQHQHEWFIADYNTARHDGCLRESYRWDDRTFILDTRRIGIPPVLTVA
jgi:hypothetical protein